MHWVEQSVDLLHDYGYPEAEAEPILDSEIEDTQFLRLNVGFMKAVDVERDGPFYHFTYNEWDVTGGLVRSDDITCLDDPPVEQVVEMAMACMDRYGE